MSEHELNEEESAGLDAGDPLTELPILRSFYDRLCQLLLECHPKSNPPGPEDDRRYREWRDALSKLARLDGYEESEIVGCLSWLYDRDNVAAEELRRQVLSLPGLRKKGKGEEATKFQMAHEQWSRQEEDEEVEEEDERERVMVSRIRQVGSYLASATEGLGQARRAAVTSLIGGGNGPKSTEAPREEGEAANAGAGGDEESETSIEIEREPAIAAKTEAAESAKSMGGSTALRGARAILAGASSLHDAEARPAADEGVAGPPTTGRIDYDLQYRRAMVRMWAAAAILAAIFLPIVYFSSREIADRSSVTAANEAAGRAVAAAVQGALADRATELETLLQGARSESARNRQALADLLDEAGRQSSETRQSMAALLEATRADSELAREATELTRTRAEAFAGLLADARDDVITASGEAKGAIDESVRSAARASDQATEALEAARSDANGVKTIVAEVQGEAAKIEEAKALAETKAQEVEAAAAKALEAVDSSNQAAEQAAAAAGKADNAIEAAGARASEIDAAAERLEREIAETSDAIASAKQSAEDATGLAATLAANPGLRRAVIDALTEVGTRQTELVKVEVAALRGMLEASESKIAALQGENEALKLGAMPTGSIVVFWADATKVPDGWLLCDGRKLADLTDAKYAKLKEVLGALKMETLPDLTAGLLPGDIETVPIEGQPPAPTVNFIIRY
jgi:hypothetical protein